MNDKFPYLEFLDIIKKQRQLMIFDTLEGNSPDLFNALYSNSDSKISEIKLELYEIQWIQSYWNEIEKIVEKRNITIREKKKLISMFSKWFESFVSGWNYTAFDIVAFEERMKILRALITVNNDWEKNLKRMKVSFNKSIKMLEDKIRELEEE